MISGGSVKARRGGVQGAARESLQIRYGALQALYYFTTCALGGFAAIFLGYKGFSSTLIRVATGSSCVLSVIAMPLASALLQRVSIVTIPRVLRWSIVGSLACYVALALAPLPRALEIPVFAIANALSLAVAPFLSQLAMGFSGIGIPINFGLARGMGSISYAIGAVGLSGLVDVVSPMGLVAAFAVAAAAFLAVLATLPACGREMGGEQKRVERNDVREAEPSGSALSEIARQRVLVMVLTGFMVAFIACNCLSVYLIDIVVNLGGDTSMYGMATFCMAASELPAMALVPRLRRRFTNGSLFMVVGVAYLLRNMVVVNAVSVPMVFVGLLFQSISYGLLTPLLTCYIAEVLSPQSETLGQTLLSVATTGVGAMVGAAAGGALQDAFGIDAMLLFVALNTVTASAIFISAGIRCRKDEASAKISPALS